MLDFVNADNTSDNVIFSESMALMLNWPCSINKYNGINADNIVASESFYTSTASFLIITPARVVRHKNKWLA